MTLRTAAGKTVDIERAARGGESLQTLAELRMAVFRQWPYLYDGSAEYEAAYLADFLRDPDAVLVIAKLDGKPIGMATASRLPAQEKAMSDPLVKNGFNLDATFYFGESVLLAQYHGLGIGHAFFDQREAAAREAHATAAAFCAVVRPEMHPMKPYSARDLAPFWRKRGYHPVEGAIAAMEWKDVDQPASTGHPMQFWARAL